MAIVDLYPTSLRLLGRPVLVVGGGTVAARRAKALLDAGAQVTLVAPVLCAPARELADAGLVRWHARGYESSDMSDAWYAVAASDNKDVDNQVAADAEANRVWCVNHSSAQESAAWTPAVATVEDVKVAVNAGETRCERWPSATLLPRPLKPVTCHCSATAIMPTRRPNYAAR